MPRIKMIIEYDGSNYHGFQRQDNAHTIQAELEKQIHTLTGEDITVRSAGRTDAGVHARGQVIAFDTAATIPADRWFQALNSLLPPDIRALNSCEVNHSFHPQYQAVSKRYLYYLYRPRWGVVFYRHYAYSVREPLDIAAMNHSCRLIKGVHNFKAFCASGSSVKTFEREVLHCEIKESGPFAYLDIEANGFLYNMVRIIMGTLLLVGRYRISVADVAKIIQSRDRTLAGPTAPAYGLYLHSVRY